MAEEKKDEHANWQKNAARRSNFNRKDSNLEKDGDGNLKIKKDRGISEEDDEMIQDTLDSLEVGEDEEE